MNTLSIEERARKDLRDRWLQDTIKNWIEAHRELEQQGLRFHSFKRAWEYKVAQDTLPYWEGQGDKRMVESVKQDMQETLEQDRNDFLAECLEDAFSGDNETGDEQGFEVDTDRDEDGVLYYEEDKA